MWSSPTKAQREVLSREAAPRHPQHHLQAPVLAVAATPALDGADRGLNPIDMARPSHDLPVATPQPSAARWTVLWVVTLQQAGVTFVRFGLPALAPFFRSDLSLSLSQTGIVLGIFDLGAMLTFYLTGLLTKHFGERRVLAAGAVLTGAATVAAASVRGLWPFVLLLAVAGTGFPSSHIAGTQAMVAWFQARERGLAMGVRQSGLPISGFVAAAMLPWLAGVLGWQPALAIAGGACAICGIITYAALPRFDAPDSPVWSARDSRLPRRQLAMATATGSFLLFCQQAFAGYLPLYMVDEFSWQPAEAARLLLVVHTGGALGRVGWGWLSDCTFRGERVRPLLIVIAGGATFLAVLASLDSASAVGSPVAAGAALAGGLTLLGWNAIVSALLAELAGPMTARVMGLSLTISSACAMVAPPLFGQAVQSLGGYAPAWAALIALQAAAALAAAQARRPASAQTVT